VQLKAVAFPTDAKLMHRACERLVRLAKKHGLALRQSYERVGKYALIAHQRYAHAKQFKRANRALRTLRTYLGRVTRDIVRMIKGEHRMGRNYPAGPTDDAINAVLAASGYNFRRLLACWRSYCPHSYA
jgi:hypothetical protein